MYSRPSEQRHTLGIGTVGAVWVRSLLIPLPPPPLLLLKLLPPPVLLELPLALGSQLLSADFRLHRRQLLLLLLLSPPLLVVGPLLLAPLPLGGLLHSLPPQLLRPVVSSQRGTGIAAIRGEQLRGRRL